MPTDCQDGPKRARLTRESQPALETLEGRQLLSGGNPVPRSFLLTPVPDPAPLAEHIHPSLTLIIDGQTQTIPAGIGILPNGDLPIHTHDATGKIHIESPRRLPFRLRDVFTVWGQTFAPRDILGHRADAQHQITMTVNGHPSRAYGNLPLRDGEQIVIDYQSSTSTVSDRD